MVIFSGGHGRGVVLVIGGQTGKFDINWLRMRQLPLMRRAIFVRGSRPCIRSPGWVQATTQFKTFHGMVV